jgi:hypothetical protein
MYPGFAYSGAANSIYKQYGGRYLKIPGIDAEASRFAFFQSSGNE